MSEVRCACALADRPHAGCGRLQSLVDPDVAAVVELDTGFVESDRPGVGRAPRGDDKVAALDARFSAAERTRTRTPCPDRPSASSASAPRRISMSSPARMRWSSSATSASSLASTCGSRCTTVTRLPKRRYWMARVTNRVICDGSAPRRVAVGHFIAMRRLSRSDRMASAGRNADCTSRARGSTLS